MDYLFEAGGSKAINSQHDRRSADEPSRHEHDVVMNLWNGANAEPDNTNACDQNSRYERLMSDFRGALPNLPIYMIQR